MGKVHLLRGLKMSRFSSENIILKPIITEKSLNDASVGRYTFEVPTWADKKSIKERVRDVFSVEPIEIKTSIYKGKPKRVLRTRLKVEGKKWKKAIVELKSGQKIALFEVKTDKK